MRNNSRASLSDRIDLSRRETLSIGQDFQKQTNRYVSGYVATPAFEHEIFPNGAADILSLIQFKARTTKDGVVKLSYREVTERLGIKRTRQETALKLLLEHGIITREKNDFFSRRRIFMYNHDRYEQVRNSYVANEPAREAARAAAAPKTWQDMVQPRNGSKQTAQKMGVGERDELLQIINTMKRRIDELEANNPTVTGHLLVDDQKSAKTEESAHLLISTNDLLISTNDLLKPALINNSISNTEVREKAEENFFAENKEQKDLPRKEVGNSLPEIGGVSEAQEIPELPAPFQQILEKTGHAALDEYGSELCQVNDMLLKNLNQELRSGDMKAAIKGRITDRVSEAVKMIERIAVEKKVARPLVPHDVQLEKAAQDSLYYTMLDTITTVFLDWGIPTLSVSDLQKYHSMYTSHETTSASVKNVTTLGAALQKWMTGISETADYNHCGTVAMDLARRVWDRTLGLSDVLVALMAWKEKNWYSPGYVQKTAEDMYRFRKASYNVKPLDVLARSGFFNMWGRIDKNDRATIHSERIDLPTTESKKSKVQYQVYKEGLPLLVAEFIHAYPDINMQKADSLFLLDLAFMRIPHFISGDFKHDAFNFWFRGKGVASEIACEAIEDGRLSTSVGPVLREDED